MEWHEQPDLPVLNPLPDTVPRAPLHTRHQRGVVGDAVEYLARRLDSCSLRVCHLRAVVRDRAGSCAAAHLAGGGGAGKWCLCAVIV